MKKVLLSALTLFFVSAAPALALVEVGGDAYVGLFDKYLWRGYDLSGNKPVAQGGIDLTIGNLTLGYWSNVQLVAAPNAGLAGGEGNETDLTVDYALPVGEVATVNLGNTFYTSEGVRDSNELYLGVKLDSLLAPEVKAYYDYDENKDDRFYTVGINPSFEYAGATLNLGALAGYADNDGAHEPWNAELTVGLDLPLDEQITLSPTFLYSLPLSNDAKEAIDSEISAGVNVTLTF